jgi:sulfur relay (sulfurtransferase) complex TusBCD TusD component (DsrE family)
MGQNQSANASTEEDSTNNISQISTEKCIQSVLDASAIKLNFVDSTIGGDINVDRVITVNGTSCNLKSSLDSQLIDKQATFQDLNLQDINKDDPIETLAREAQNITPWGAAESAFSTLLGKNQTINEKNIQKVINEVTQQMNSICQNKVATENAPIIQNFDGTNVKGSVNINDKQQVSNTSCTITNQARSYVKNDQTNTQKGSITRLQEDGLIAGFIALIIAIAVIGMVTAFGMKAFSKKRKSVATNPQTYGNPPPPAYSKTPPPAARTYPPATYGSRGNLAPPPTGKPVTNLAPQSARTYPSATAPPAYSKAPPPSAPPPSVLRQQ